jgi:hypothetical protein
MVRFLPLSLLHVIYFPMIVYSDLYFLQRSLFRHCLHRFLSHNFLHEMSFPFLLRETLSQSCLRSPPSYNCFITVSFLIIAYRDLFPMNAGVEGLRSIMIVSRGLQLLPKVRNRRIVLVLAERKRRGVIRMTVQRSRLARHALDHHGDGHAAGEAVGVEDDVGHEAARRPGDVLAGIALAQDALLAGTRGEFVANRGVPSTTVILYNVQTN